MMLDLCIWQLHIGHDNCATWNRRRSRELSNRIAPFSQWVRVLVFMGIGGEAMSWATE
jgi:hypothetical protein